MAATGLNVCIGPGLTVTVGPLTGLTVAVGPPTGLTCMRSNLAGARMRSLYARVHSLRAAQARQPCPGPGAPERVWIILSVAMPPPPVYTPRATEEGGVHQAPSES